MIFVGLLIVFPLVWTIYLSLTDSRGSVRAPADFIGLGNYMSVLSDFDRFWPAVGRTAYFTFTALAVERVLLRTTRGATADSLSILTIGVDIIILTDLTRRIGANVLGLGDPWRDKLVRLAGFSDAAADDVVAAIMLIALLFAATKFTNWGISTRAYAEDREAAALMGIKQWRVSAIAWTIAGALAAVASIFLTAFPTPGLDNNTGLDALKAFPAAILGGLDSTTGALVGGITVGLAETFTSGYENDLLFLGRGFGSTMPYVIMILVLLWRPSGLFGTRTVARV